MAIALLLAWPMVAGAQHRKDFTTPTPLPPGDTLVIGFLGGIEKWKDINRRPVNELARRLRESGLSGVYVETAEHRHRDEVLKLIEDAAGRDPAKRGTCSPAGCRTIRIILYGHSMGAAAAVRLARELKKQGLPVALTVQVDSVGTSDGVIPSNVSRAANLYQDDSRLLHGQTLIRAEDPSKTTILANLHYTYDEKSVDLSEASIPEQILHSRHTQMEFDPEVWERVESYILDELRRPLESAAVAAPAH
jgi:pimeloyl-ACP methyl ester carboxylesterase